MPTNELDQCVPYAWKTVYDSLAAQILRQVVTAPTVLGFQLEHKKSVSKMKSPQWQLESRQN